MVHIEGAANCLKIKDKINLSIKGPFRWGQESPPGAHCTIFFRDCLSRASSCDVTLCTVSWTGPLLRQTRPLEHLARRPEAWSWTYSSYLLRRSTRWKVRGRKNSSIVAACQAETVLVIHQERVKSQWVVVGHCVCSRVTTVTTAVGSNVFHKQGWIRLIEYKYSWISQLLGWQILGRHNNIFNYWTQEWRKSIGNNQN